MAAAPTVTAEGQIEGRLGGSRRTEFRFPSCNGFLDGSGEGIDGLTHLGSVGGVEDLDRLLDPTDRALLADELFAYFRQLIGRGGGGYRGPSRVEVQLREVHE